MKFITCPRFLSYDRYARTIGFLDLRAKFGAPNLARKSKKPIVLAYLSYDRNLGHVMNFKKPSKEIYSESGVQVMNDEMESVIRQSPAEYSWEYKKFRRLLSVPQDIYKD